MATLTTVRLNRGDSPNWGFRLQGGKDFGTPLVIQKVNGGSPAERAGLIAGDAVIKINNVDVYNLLHKEAQDVIVKSGFNFDMVIQRGGSTWKPSVVPTGTFPKPSPTINNVSPVTKTSLAANQRENIGAIGTGHNVAAKPFNTQVNGAVNGGPKLVNKQYNSPLKLYSEDAIAESLSAQTEVLSTGALGVNFKKNEKDYDSSNSAVYRMLQEAENDAGANETEPDSGIVTAPNRGMAGLRHVEAPISRPAPPNPQLPPGQNICADCERLIIYHRSFHKAESRLQQIIASDFYSSHNYAIGARQIESPRPTTLSDENIQSQKPASESVTICTDCERVIVGVFVRIKDKNLHVECFKCATCGSSLKNVGYYNINNKLYCDVHAKAAAIAINNPSAIPITISPGSKAPVSAISAALSTHSYPSSPLSTKVPSYTPSYQPAEEIIGVPPAADGLSSTPLTSLPSLNSAPSAQSNIKPSSSSLFNTSAPLSFSKYINKPSNFSGPKPFSSVSAPLSPGGTFPRAAAAPLSPQTNYNKAPLSPSAPSYGSYSPSTEHVSDVFQTNPCEPVTDLDEVCQSLPPPPPLQTVPVYSQINITIPQHSFHAPSQLDSIGSSPRSDYSSHSSSSGKHQQSMDTAKEKVITEINKGLIPKLKRVNLSKTQSPRLNYIVSNVNTVIENNVKRVKSELVIPINNSNTNSIINNKNSNTNNQIATENSLPDHLTFANKSSNHQEFTERTFKSFEPEDAEDKFRDSISKLICWKCNTEIFRGPFITALGKIWCPQHFICTTPSCRRPLQDLGFVEENGQLYCEYCFEQYLAPPCSKCHGKIKGDCLKAIGKNFHPECFNCVYCGKLFANSPFFLEDGNPYCDADWNELFTTKCYACGFPVEAGDRWVEALSNNYHSQCFNCTMCKKNLEGQSFFAKGGRPFCKNHAR